MIRFADASAPCQDECEDQELSSYYKVDLLVDRMELTVEKATTTTCSTGLGMYGEDQCL